jgi:hypothetical protein
MKTLIIHQLDATTQFLKKLYLDDATLLNHLRIGNGEIKRNIKTHDRIVMMGHGCDSGLLCTVDYKRLLISSKHVQTLRTKKCIGIWCYASDFFKKYGLTGVATGMFISETDEAWMMLGMNSVESESMIKESEELLATCFKKCETYEDTLALYKTFDINEIQRYNAERIEIFN